jgi:SNF family Na+-dependent transporter
VFRPEADEGKGESLDSRQILLLVAVGYAVGFGNVWCLCALYRRVVVVSARGGLQRS